MSNPIKYSIVHAGKIPEAITLPGDSFAPESVVIQEGNSPIVVDRISAATRQAADAGLIIVTPPVDTITRFTDLEDAPNSYAGNSGKALVVNPQGTGLIFGEAGAGGPLPEETIYEVGEGKQYPTPNALREHLESTRPNGVYAIVDFSSVVDYSPNVQLTFPGFQFVTITSTSNLEDGTPLDLGGSALNIKGREDQLIQIESFTATGIGKLTADYVNFGNTILHCQDAYISNYYADDLYIYQTSRNSKAVIRNCNQIPYNGYVNIFGYFIGGPPTEPSIFLGILENMEIYTDKRVELHAGASQNLSVYWEGGDLSSPNDSLVTVVGGGANHRLEIIEIATDATINCALAVKKGGIASANYTNISAGAGLYNSIYSQEPNIPTEDGLILGYKPGV